MMKLMKKLAVLVLAFAACLAVAVPVQAAVKTTTYVLDSKNGVYAPTKVRAGLDSRYNTCRIYLVNEGDYVASVKSNSSKMITKVTEKTAYTGNVSMGYELEDVHFKGSAEITYFTRTKGTYTLTVTIKNAKGKKVAAKKIKVFAEEYAEPFKKVTYAGKDINYGNSLFSKGNAKLSVTMNKGFSLQKIEVGVLPEGVYSEYRPSPVYKTVKNNAAINLAASTKYTADSYKYDGYSYSYSRGRNYDYLYPITYIRITYKDNKLGIVKTREYELFYKNS